MGVAEPWFYIYILYIMGGVVLRENGRTIPSPNADPTELFRASWLGLSPDPGPNDG